MRFEVRSEVFEITFVNNYVREEYQKMLDVVDELTELPSKMQEAANDKALIKELRKNQKDYIHQIGDLRREILVEILTTNGYEYDERFWMRKTDVDDINNFVLDCIRKDVKASESKKK